MQESVTGSGGDTPNSRETPGIRPAYLSSDRLELASWVRRSAPSLADLYLGALDLLYGPPIPGRCVLICHAVREIANRLPGRVSGLETEGPLGYSQRIDKIADGWERAGLGADATVPLEPELVAAGPTPATTVYVSIPPDVYVLFAKLVRDHRRASAKPTETARRLFTAADPDGNAPSVPAIVLWNETVKWFVSRTHDSGRTDAAFDHDELRKNFSIIEQALLAAIGSFYPRLDELDAILADANA